MWIFSSSVYGMWDWISAVYIIWLHQNLFPGLRKAGLETSPLLWIEVSDIPISHAQIFFLIQSTSQQITPGWELVLDVGSFHHKVY